MLTTKELNAHIAKQTELMVKRWGEEVRQLAKATPITPKKTKQPTPIPTPHGQITGIG